MSIAPKHHGGVTRTHLIPEIVANNFELKHGLINLVQNKQFFGLCQHHGILELHQLDTSYNALNINDQDSLELRAGTRRTKLLSAPAPALSNAVCNCTNTASTSESGTLPGNKLLTREDLKGLTTRKGDDFKACILLLQVVNPIPESGKKLSLPDLIQLA
ncbi:hypothetical protein Tco_0603204 [Tanacetum coccineum]